jgi:hypothetical protein
MILYENSIAAKILILCTYVTTLQENPFEEPRSNPSSSNSNSTARASNPTNFSADLASLLHNLDAIPEYLRRLERQKMSAEKSNEAKALKIFELEEEIARYVLHFSVRPRKRYLTGCSEKVKPHEA